MSLELSTQLAEGARGRAIGLLLGSLLAVTGLYACGDGDTDTDSNTNTNADTGTDTGTATGNKSDAGGNTKTATGQVQLNEIDCHGRDRIELYNPSKKSVDVSGWSVADDLHTTGHQYEIPKGSTVPAGGFFVVRQEKAPDPGFTFGIKCGGDSVYLLGPDKTVVDSVRLGDVSDNATWGRIPDGSGEWQETLPTEGGANQLPTSMSAQLFDPTAVYSIQINLNDTAKGQLNMSPYDYVSAEFTVTVGGRTLGPLEVGLRLKSGESFQPLSGKAAFKVRFDEYQSGQRLFGLTDLNLNNMVQDPSFMRETLAYLIFRSAGVPAPRTGYATVQVNGDNYGLYAVIEKYNADTCSAWFADTQHIYEGSSVDLLSGNAGRFSVDDGSKTDISDLEALINAVNNTADGTWISDVSKLANLNEMVRLFVVENLVGQTDGYIMVHNNYFLHSDSRGVFSMMPWGTDRAFTEKLALPSGNSALVTRCLAITGCRSLWDQELTAALTTMQGLGLEAYIDKLNQTLSSRVTADPRKPGSVADYQAAVSALKSFISARLAKQ